MDHIKKVEVDQHQVAITGLPEGFKHQIHPKRFASAVDFLAHISGHARKFQRAKIFEGYESGRAALAGGSAGLKEIKIISPLLVHEAQQTFKNDSAFHDTGP